MIGRFDHDVDATLDRAPGAVNGTRWWYLACECAELVRDHAHLPRAIAIRQPQHLGRRLVLIARAKWTVRGIRSLRPWLPVHDQLFGPLGALSGDHNPCLGEKVLAEFGHGRVSLLLTSKTQIHVNVTKGTTAPVRLWRGPDQRRSEE